MPAGVFNVLKPPGMTSHDVISYLRKITGERKTGHAGTLDPDAAGVLPVFVGAATRVLEYAEHAEKSYLAWVRFGIKTDTGDDSGEIIERCSVPDFSEIELTAALTGLTGDIMQVPPMRSALKINGQRLYKLARAGQTVERVARPVKINQLKILCRADDKILLEINCSKGTYIRTLAEDLAGRLGTCATLTFLLRTRAGMFFLGDAGTLEEISNRPEAHLLPADAVLKHLGELRLTLDRAGRFVQGVKIAVPNNLTGNVRVYSPDGLFIGIGETDGQTLKPRKVLNNVR